MNNIKQRRLEMGLKQQELAGMLREYDPRIDVPTLSRIETGKVLPSAAVLEGLTVCLQASGSELFGELELFATMDTEPDLSGDAAAKVALVEANVPRGRANAVSRKELRRRLGLPETDSGDRMMRLMIETGKKAGLLICNDQDSKGYYIAEDPEEIKRELGRITNRIRSLSRQAAQYRRALK